MRYLPLILILLCGCTSINLEEYEIYKVQPWNDRMLQRCLVFCESYKDCNCQYVEHYEFRKRGE